MPCPPVICGFEVISVFLKRDEEKAAHLQSVTGDVGSKRAQEEHHGVGRLLRLSRSAEGDLRGGEKSAQGQRVTTRLRLTPGIGPVGAGPLGLGMPRAIF